MEFTATSIAMCCRVGAIALALACGTGTQSAVVRAPVFTDPESLKILPAAQWKKVENAVDRALRHLASTQQPDGSFPTYKSGQPAVTSLCVMAFLSRGHQPGVGPYGQPLDRAIDFVLSCQAKDRMFSHLPLEDRHVGRGASHTVTYNHPIAGLMLGEAYGVTDPVRAEKIRPAIEKALSFCRGIQTGPKRMPADQGGWRYYYQFPKSLSDSDLSVTGWNLMFYRSAKNAEFDVPKQYMDDAMAYVLRCYQPASGTFFYGLHGENDLRATRGMMGCGILALALGGRHNTLEAKKAGDWVLRNPFRRFGETVGKEDRFFYGAYYCSQGMFQLGGDYWRKFYPPLANALLSGQLSNGAWPKEGMYDGRFGNCYTTAMAVLSLTPPFQLIPIYQR